jgi:serine/threonine-protein kinase
MDSTAGRVGTVIADRYILEGVLGRGGMGIVYRAVHRLTRREVAVKLLEKIDAADEQNVARFFDEAQAAAKLEHPNVVEVLDMGTLEDGAVFLALELLRGETLADLLARGRRLSLDDAYEYLIPIMNGLAEAHRAGLVHRDLKPANIFLHEAGDRIVPKLLDFGVAKRLDGTSLHETQDGQIVGTPYFMAPEQIEGKGLGPQADVFSMAVVWYLVLSGRLPFRGENHFHVLTAISKGEHIHLSQVDETIPKALSSAVEAGLRREAAERPFDITSFRDLLLAARPTLRDVLGSDTLESPPERLTPPALELPPKPKPSPPEPRPEPKPEEPSSPKRELPKPKIEPERRSRVPFIVVAAAIAIGAFLALRPSEAPPRPVPSPPPTPPPPAVAAVDAGFVSPRATTLKARDAALLAQDALTARAREMKASVDAFRAEMERRARQDPSARESFEASAAKAEAQLAACERERIAPDLETRWKTADEMFRAQELAIATTYYRELDQKMKAIAEGCVLTEIPILETAQPIDRRAVPPNVVGKAPVHAVLTPEQAHLLDLDRRLLKDEKDEKLRFERAELRLALGDTLGALEDLDRLIAADPSVVAYWAARANVQAARSKHREAASDLERAVALAPDRPDLLIRLGRSLSRAKDAKSAIAALGKAIDAKPSAEAHFERGMAHLEANALDRAIDDFTKTLELDPSFGAALLQRGIARVRTDEPAAAIADLDAFLARSPSADDRAVALRWLDAAQAQR